MHKQSWILYMSTYPPRECGIATFTKDLTRATDKKCSSSIKTKICAMNKNSVNIYNYPEEVIFQIDDSNIQEYIDTAKNINQIEEIKLISIQHEFGIFGGEYGSYLIPFLEIVDKPVIVTLHSLIPNPNERLKKVMQSIAKKAACLVVMTPKAIEILRKDYEVNTEIKVIPHGIPTVPFNNNIEEKKKLGYDNKIILTSFGLISSGKGYEYVIGALPEVVKKFPNILYLILGETHPTVRKKEGEKYRNFLERKVKELGLQNNVKFYNKYLALNEILKYLGATDIYVSSSLDPNQITSGTLAYAMGCGRATVSTPFLHAQDIVNHERGLLVEFNKSPSFADAVIKILSDFSLKENMERNAYVYTRHMTWPNVALSYLNLFDRHIEMFGEHELPEINLNHLATLTDDFGIIQFADHAIPDIMSGYTLDDNARAMIVCCLHYNKFKEKTQLKLIRIYLNFMEYVQQEDGRLYNLVDHNKEVDLKHWSDDAHGRTLWALGYLISLPSMPLELKERAKQIFTKAVKIAKEIKSPRAAAFTIIGLYHYNQTQPITENIRIIRQLANHLVSIYHDNSSKGWSWFEEYLTYSNSKLPEALFYAYLATHDEKCLEIAKVTLNFLSSVTFEKGRFNPIGQNGWYVINRKKAHFDQQPVDTASMVQTLMLAYNITRNDKYKEDAITAFQWFLGNNSLQQMVYDESTGGCHDGLGEFSVNLNRGAESTVSYLMARLAIDNWKMSLKKAIILAGGLGTRLKSLTEKMPKPLLPVQGKPLLQHIIENLRNQGITEIILSVGYKADQIKGYFGDGSQLGVTITYCYETEPLGTGGAVKKAAQHLREPFFLVWADNLMDIDYEELHKTYLQNKKQITMTLTPREDVENFGVAKLEGERIMAFVEKPEREKAPTNLINAGALIIDPECLKILPEGVSSIEKDCFEKLAPQGEITAHIHKGQWFPIDTIEKYHQTKEEFKEFSFNHFQGDVI